MTEENAVGKMQVREKFSNSSRLESLMGVHRPVSMLYRMPIGREHESCTCQGLSVRRGGDAKTYRP